MFTSVFQLFKKPHPQKKVFRAVEPDLQTGATSIINVDRLFFHNLPNLVPSAQPVKGKLIACVNQLRFYLHILKI
jgi:hypothetical protein